MTEKEQATERIVISVTPTFKKLWVDYCEEQDRPQSKQFLKIAKQEMKKDGVIFNE